MDKPVSYTHLEIGTILGVGDLEYCAARHLWATIALNKVGIHKYIVHAALNHIDDSMKVTDIYIERDFVNEMCIRDRMYFVFPVCAFAVVVQLIITARRTRRNLQY